jgi:hypothetical protein
MFENKKLSLGGSAAGHQMADENTVIRPGD